MKKTNKGKDVTGPGVSDPQGPAGVGGVVPAPSPSSSDDGLPPVSRVGTGGARTITQFKFQLSPSQASRLRENVRELEEGAEEWRKFFAEVREIGVDSEMEEMDSIFPGGSANLDSLIVWFESVVGNLRWIGSIVNRIGATKGGVRVETGAAPPSSLPSVKEMSGVGTGPCPWVPSPPGQDACVGPTLRVRSRGVQTPRRWSGRVPAPTAENSSGGSPAVKNNAAPGKQSERGRARTAESSSGGSSALHEAVSQVHQRRRGGSVRGTPRSRLGVFGPAGPSYAEAVRVPCSRVPGIKILAPGLGMVRLGCDGEGDLVVEVPAAVETIVEDDSGGENFSLVWERKRRKRGWRRVGCSSTILPREWPARCYSCLEVGHVAANCPAGKCNRGMRCYRCGASSHKMVACRAGSPRCPLCVDYGLPAGHILGGDGCRLPPADAKRSKLAGGASLSPGAGRGLPPSKIGGGSGGQRRGLSDSRPEGWDPGESGGGPNTGAGSSSGLLAARGETRPSGGGGDPR